MNRMPGCRLFCFHSMEKIWTRFPLNGKIWGWFSTQWKLLSGFSHSMEIFERVFPFNGKRLCPAVIKSLAILALCLPVAAEAGAGFWKQFVVIDRGSGNEYFGDPLADNFDGEDLGTWVQGDPRYLNGAEANTWEDEGDWVDNVWFNYRVGTNDFTGIALGQRSHVGNDRMWDQTAENILLTDRDPGTYTLQVYFFAHGNFDNEGGSGFWELYDSAEPDYEATFTITALGSPSNPSASATSGNTINLTWSRWEGRNVVIARSTTNSFTQPVDGEAPPSVGQPFAGGTLVYNGSGTSFNNTGLQDDTTYYYRFFTINNNFYSSGVDASATTLTEAEPTISVPVGDLDFGTMSIFLTSDPVSYEVIGSALTEGITVSVAEPFQVSASSVGPYVQSIELSSEGGTVWVRFDPVTVGTHSEIISHTSAGADPDERTATGVSEIIRETAYEPSLVNSKEVILQYFGTSWRELARRIPEVAEAGYTSFWLPVPQKASGGLSVGYDVSDRFDLGDKPRAGGATKYGTKTDLLYMMRMAHRFGLRVYFDTVMAHTGGFMPEGEPYELNDLGFVPADFHLVRREDGSYYKYDWPDWQDEWQVLYRNPFSWDIATDWGGFNNSFGAHEGAVTQKWFGVRHPYNPEFYAYVPDGSGGRHANSDGIYVGFGNVTQEDLDENPEFYEEEVNEFLNRSIRWFVDTTKADGFRLDAVKHVRADFFGADGEDADTSDFGYTGQFQRQFNLTHGFEDWHNHRDSVFNPSLPRDDAMSYGEHLGAPPAEGPYLERGMRIANDNFLNAMNNMVGENLSGMDSPSYGIYGGNPHAVAHYVMSHDNNYLWGGDEWNPWGNRPQAHALLLAREGLPIVYTDGYNQAGEPDYFPYPSQIPFLGQFRDGAYGAWMLNLMHIRRHFGWGGHWPRWGDQDHVVWVRGRGDNHGQASMMFAMVRRFAGGDRQPFELVDSVFNEGDVLYKTSHWGSFRVRVDGGRVREMDGSPINVGPGDWWAISWRLPNMPDVWRQGDWWERPIQPIMIYQDDEPAETVWVPRRDGRDGDPAFNPYGLPNADPTDRTYHMPIPRVTSSENLSFVARADGTVENIMMKLNGGIDLNSQMWSSTRNQQTGARDNPPGTVTDFYLGYEQMRFAHRIAEKFASVETAYNRWGSIGATSYETTIGSAGFSIANPDTPENTWEATFGPRFLYHDPSAETEGLEGGEDPQFYPAPEAAADESITLWVKAGSQFHTDKVFMYYTTDGETWPEGSGGVGGTATKVAEFGWQYNQAEEGETNDWWMVEMPAYPSGTVLRYKIGGYRDDIGALFPYSEFNIDMANRMETKFVVTNFNAGTIAHFPHNNWNVDQMEQGLEEGFHVLRTKAFLGRDSDDAPIFRERVQTFYYDVERPTGYFLWPPNDDEWVSGSYGLVLRTDMTVTEVWYNIEESDNQEDWDPRGWARASRQNVPAPAPDGTMEQEWRFDFDDIPETGWARARVILREVTSSEDLELSDEDGHFTTLTRNFVTGGGPRIRIMNPAAGEVFPDGGELEVWLSPELWDGIGPEDQLATFSLEINGIPQPDVTKSLLYDNEMPEDEHGIFFGNLPPLGTFGSDPEQEHVIEVLFDRAGFDSRRTSRLFQAGQLSGFAAWLLQHDLPSDTDMNAPIPDHPAGYTYEDAYIANLSPTSDPLEVMIALHPTDPDIIRLMFPSRLNRLYRVYGLTSLLGEQEWMQLGDDIAGDGGALPFRIDDRSEFDEEDALMYRIGVSLPNE